MQRRPKQLFAIEVQGNTCRHEFGGDKKGELFNVVV